MTRVCRRVGVGVLLAAAAGSILIWRGISEPELPDSVPGDIRILAHELPMGSYASSYLGGGYCMGINRARDAIERLTAYADSTPESRRHLFAYCSVRLRNSFVADEAGIPRVEWQ